VHLDPLNLGSGETSEPKASTPPAPTNPPTGDPTSGVEAEDLRGEGVAPRSRLASARRWVGLAFTSLVLLGQGERCHVDPRFVSPSATLRTYWEALRAGDAEGVWECFVEGRHDLPMPGMLWYLPPIRQLTLCEFRSLPVTGGRVMVSYEVRYLPSGLTEEHSFRTADELVRMRGHWRIARPVSDAAAPPWDMTPRPVDS